MEGLLGFWLSSLRASEALAPPHPSYQYTSQTILILYYLALSFWHFMICSLRFKLLLKTIWTDILFFCCWSGFPSGRPAT